MDRTFIYWSLSKLTASKVWWGRVELALTEVRWDMGGDSEIGIEI